jgi:predicted DNA-binding protein YlxM (UPF0122 family)
MTPKSTEHQQAFNLYFQSDLTNNQIADMLNIDRKTLFTWAKEGDWKKAKDTIRHAPSFLVEQYYDQLNEINKAIAQRTERPYPTKEEATIIKTISATIKQIGVRQSASEAMDVFIDFGLEVCRYDPAFHREMMRHMDKYIQHLTDHSLERYRSRYRWEQKKDQEYEQYLTEQEELAKPASPAEASAKEGNAEKGGDDGVMDSDALRPVPPLTSDGAALRSVSPLSPNGAALRSVSPLSSNGVIMGSSSEASQTAKSAPEATNQNSTNAKSEEKNENGVMSSRTTKQIFRTVSLVPKPVRNELIVDVKRPMGHTITVLDPAGNTCKEKRSGRAINIIPVHDLPNGRYTVIITDREGCHSRHEFDISH